MISGLGLELRSLGQNAGDSVVAQSNRGPQYRPQILQSLGLLKGVPPNWGKSALGVQGLPKPQKYVK